MIFLQLFHDKHNTTITRLPVTYTVKCSSHFGETVLRHTSVFLGGWPSTLSSRYGSGLDEKSPPAVVIFADFTVNNKQKNNC